MIEKESTFEELKIENENLKKQLFDKKDIEKELSKARILMQAAFDQSPIPMVVASYPDFTFKIINKATEDFLLVSSKNYLNKKPIEVDWNWQEFSPEGEPVKSITELPLPLAMQGITTKNKEMTIERHDGSRVVELASGAPIYDAEGELIAGILVMVDITERKKTEQMLSENESKLKEQNEEYETLNEELREANEQLHIAKNKAEESDKLKTAFLQNMSHEIRTPMNAIMGFSDLLFEYSDDKDKLKMFTDIISQRCNDLLDIIDDILDISKIESGQLTVSNEECNLKELFYELNSFFTEYQNRIGKQQISLKFETQFGLIDDLIVTDNVKLKQILINLINNAFKFTDEGIIEVSCKLNENKNLLFYVSDTGIGIPRDKHNAIFERFTQLHQDSIKSYGGTGLGLSIVKGLVTLLGGKIFLESDLGKGSTFYFTIPYETVIVSHHSALESENHNNRNYSNKTILIVEDDIYNAKYLKEILSGIGLDILHAENGKDAISMSLSKQIDLILMDIRLPDTDGYEVTQQIIKHNPNLKIIAQTAYAAQDERQKALTAGCIDYISKPTKRNILLSLIHKYL